MELFLFTVSSLMLPRGVWQYHDENLYQLTMHSGAVLAVVPFFSTQQRLSDDNDGLSGTQL